MNTYPLILVLYTLLILIGSD